MIIGYFVQENIRISLGRRKPSLRPPVAIKLFVIDAHGSGLVETQAFQAQSGLYPAGARHTETRHTGAPHVWHQQSAFAEVKPTFAQGPYFKQDMRPKRSCPRLQTMHEYTYHPVPLSCFLSACSYLEEASAWLFLIGTE